MTERESLLKRIMIYGFAAYEWNLYLDTHPYDAEAIKLYHSMIEAEKEAKNEYERKYGPITAAASKDMEYWNWIDSPWPWEKY